MILLMREILIGMREEKLLKILDRNDSDMIRVFKTKYTDYLKSERKT